MQSCSSRNSMTTVSLIIRSQGHSPSKAVFVNYLNDGDWTASAPVDIRCFLSVVLLDKCTLA